MQNIRDLLDQLRYERPFAAGLSATVYYVPDFDDIILRVPDVLADKFWRKLGNSTCLTAPVTLRRLHTPIVDNVGQPLISLMSHSSSNEDVTFNRRVAGKSADCLRSEIFGISFRQASDVDLMEWVSNLSADEWENGFTYLVKQYDTIRKAGFTADSQGDNLMVDLLNLKLSFVDVFDGERRQTSLAEMFANIIAGSIRQRHTSIRDERPLTLCSSHKTRYQKQAKKVLGWIVAAAEELQIPFILYPSELEAERIGRPLPYLLSEHCGYEGQELADIKGRIEATRQYSYDIRLSDRKFFKTKIPGLGYASSIQELRKALSNAGNVRG